MRVNRKWYKVFAVLCLVALVVALCPALRVGAEEIGSSGEAVIEDPAPVTKTDLPAEAAESYFRPDGTFDYERMIADLMEIVNAKEEAGEEGATFYTRLGHWAKAHVSDLIAFGLFVATVVFIYFLKKWKDGVSSDVKRIFKKQAETEATAKAETEGYNEMVDAYEKMQEEITKKRQEDAARDLVAATSNKMLTFMCTVFKEVYINARNTPNYIKDAINEAYYDMRKSFSEDEQKVFDAVLKAIDIHADEPAEVSEEEKE